MNLKTKEESIRSYENNALSSEMQFREAFLKAQKEFEPADKSGENPHFKSHYSTLTDVWKASKEALHKNGFTIHQNFCISVNGLNTLKTKLCHVSGYIEESEILLPVNIEPQKMGSAISYYRRYSLAAILSLTQADDDGESVTERSHAIATPGASQEYRVGIPKSKDYGKTLDEIGMMGVTSSFNYWSDRIKKEGKPATGEVKKFLEHARIWLEGMNNANRIDEEMDIPF